MVITTKPRYFVEIQDFSSHLNAIIFIFHWKIFLANSKNCRLWRVFSTSLEVTHQMARGRNFVTGRDGSH